MSFWNTLRYQSRAGTGGVWLSPAQYLTSPFPPSHTQAHVRQGNVQPSKGTCKSLRKCSNGTAVGRVVPALCSSTSHPAWTPKSSKNAVSPRASSAQSLPVLQADVTTTAPFCFWYREGKGGSSFTGEARTRISFYKTSWWKKTQNQLLAHEPFFRSEAGVAIVALNNKRTCWN